MTNIQQEADDAELIVDGYAYTGCDKGYRVLNLNHPASTALLSDTGEMYETTMDDIELSIARKYFAENRKYLGGAYA